jgi:DNA polymerase-4
VGGLLPLEQALAQGLVGDWQALRQAQSRPAIAEHKADPYTLPLFGDLD